METHTTTENRLRHGDQRIIATAAGIAESLVSRCMRHGARPGWDTAKALASITGTDPADWMDGRREKLLADLSTQEAQGRLDALKREQEKNLDPGLRRGDGEEAA